MAGNHPDFAYPEPPGWTIQVRPDGIVHMHRTRQSRVIQTAAMLLGMLLVLVIAARMLAIGHLSPLSNPGDNSVLFAIYLVLALAAGLLQGQRLLQSLYGTEEWLVTANSLTVRSVLFGRSWEQQFTDATLAIRSYWSRGGYEGYSTGLLVRTGRGGTSRQWGGRGNAVALAEYLSRLTGWTVTDWGGNIWSMRV